MGIIVEVPGIIFFTRALIVDASDGWGTNWLGKKENDFPLNQKPDIGKSWTEKEQLVSIL